MNDVQDVDTTLQQGNAENTAEVESAATDQTTYEPTESGENLLNPQEGNGEQQPKVIPYERFTEVNTKYKQLESTVGELQQKAQLLEQLQSNPQLAQAFLSNMPQAQQQIDPAISRAQEKLKEMGYVRGEDVQSLVSQALQEYEHKQTLSQRNSELMKKYDGSNGMPKYDPMALADFIEKKGVIYDDAGHYDLEAMYQIMNQSSYIDAAAKGARGTYSEKGGQPGQTSTNKTDEDTEIEEAKRTGDITKVLMRRSSFK